MRLLPNRLILTNKRLLVIVILLVLIFNREYLIAFSVKNGNQYHNLLKPTKDDVKCITDNTITQKTCGFSGPQFVGSINHETNDLHAVDIRTWQPNWGNALSIYWHMRGMAYLGGFEFSTGITGGDSWMSNLPTKVKAPPKSEGNCTAAFNSMCNFCQSDNGWSWYYPHRCVAARYIIKDVVKDTRMALETYAEKNRLVLPKFEKTDVVIYTRCEKGLIMGHSEYAPVAFSFYDSMPLETKRIFVVSCAKYILEDEGCAALNASLFNHLERKFPQIELIYSSSDIFTDFAKLVYAPTLYKEPSSFALWAGLANSGTVWSTSLLGPEEVRFDAPNWRWSPAQALIPNVGKQYGLSDRSEISKVVEWLETH